MAVFGLPITIVLLELKLIVSEEVKDIPKFFLN